MFQWKKIGKVFTPQEVSGRPWLKEFAQAPATLVCDTCATGRATTAKPASMSRAITFRSDAASAEQLAALLRRCDARFVPPLSSRVELAAYARKIASHALRLEAWAGIEPVALLAMYCNDLDTRIAYITSVSVVPAYARRGIARALLAQAVHHARAAGMLQIELEVDAANGAALRLYHNNGFAAADEPGPTIRMSMNLPAEDNHD